ncbi:MAG: gephyrin-like molybdotransferase Glp [Candidatus Binatia bacterium]
MISVDEALAAVLEWTPVLGVERVGLADALGRVAAADVTSARAVPSAANSAMDGYAVRGADVAASGARLRVIGVQPAGSVSATPVEPGTAMKIYTGSVVPPGADTVVKVEITEERDGVVLVREAVVPGLNVRHAGEDVQPGAVVVLAGTVLGAADLGVLASVGQANVVVHRRPRVAIVSTGAELVEVDETPGPGQVVNSNAYALAAAVREAGAEPTVLPIARDREDAIRAALREAARADVVLSTGGVSVGDFDFVKEALDALGVERRFWKVAQRPGKPLTFGRLHERLFFGLPGNPVSALVCFHVYVWPALRRMAGHVRIHHPIVEATLAATIRTAEGLTEFVRVRLAPGAGGWVAMPAASQSSGVLTGLAAGAALLIGPPEEGRLEAGGRHRVLVIAPAVLDRTALVATSG